MAGLATLLSIFLLSAQGFASNTDRIELLFPQVILGDNNLEPIENAKGTEAYERSRAVAKYNLKRDRRCSSTRVGENMFITAQHCLETDLSYCWFTLNYEFTADYETYVQLDCKAVEYRSPSLDFVLIEVKPDDKLKGFPIIPIAKALPQMNQTLWVAGFPKTTTYKQIDRSENCKVVGVEEDYVHHSCDTESNSSGSGIIDRATGSLYGVHRGSGFMANMGTHSNAILKDIEANSPSTLAKIKVAQ